MGIVVVEKMWLLIPKLTQSDLTKAWSEVYIYMYEVKYKISSKYVKVCKVPQQCISNILRLKSGVTQKKPVQTDDTQT